MKLAGKTSSALDVVHLYKYMRIYLWSALRIKALRKRDLVAEG
jgi:hypothetical protein